MITVQSLMFTLPSVFIGYLLSIPALVGLESFLFAKIDFSISPVPSSVATLEALALGLLIPFLSSIVPIQTAL